MVAVALALASALSYGLSDFVGGILSKDRSVWSVATASGVTIAAGTGVIALLAPGDPSAADFAWGAAAGLGGALGIVFLYRGLSRGRMGVVAPISGTGAALVPVVVGIAGGEQPSVLVWVGIVLAFPAIYMIPQADGSPQNPSGGPPPPSAAADGVVAGLGFGVEFAMIGQIGEDAGFLPLTLMQVAIVAAIALSAIALRQPLLLRGPGKLPVFAFGLLGMAATVCFQLATRQGLLTVVAVIASLYPASTVAMAAIFLGERIGRLQVLGLAFAAAAVVLITVG
ncbi:MAG TPA: EamA family transporter [Solirubrobacterales bacterium]|nr:EamA family transporter [Solirubrobacterales bacterium]